MLSCSIARTNRPCSGVGCSRRISSLLPIASSPISWPNFIVATALQPNPHLMLIENIILLEKNPELRDRLVQSFSARGCAVRTVPALEAAQDAAGNGDADLLILNLACFAESGRGFFETLGPLFFAIGITLSVLGTGVVLWLAGKLFDAKESVTAALMIATYAEVPRVVQILTNAAQGLFMSPEKLTSINSVGFSPARFMDPDHASAVMIALVSRVDVFTIWITVLLAIGLHVVGKIPKQQAAIAAAITWVVGALPAVFGALRGG